MKTSSRVGIALGAAAGAAWFLLRRKGLPLDAEKSITIYRPQQQVERARAKWENFPRLVLVREAAGGRGTELIVHHRYQTPGARLWHKLARLLALTREDHDLQQLRLFKQFVETGEQATTAGQPSGKLRLRSSR
jgi:uncharacterized membrane protein